MATDKRTSADRVIVTAAITGSRITREATPHIPITPEEIANSAVEAVGAGASMVHIHVRDSKTGLGAQDVSLFKRVMDDVQSR